MLILTGFLLAKFSNASRARSVENRVFGTMQRLNKNMFFKIDILGTLSSLNYILGYNFVNFVCYLGHGIGEDHAWHTLRRVRALHTV